MLILYILLAVLAVFIIALNVNALKCKPQEINSNVVINKLNINTDAATENLAKMIRCKTISDKDHSKVDESEFDKFKDLLKQLYPTVHEQAAPENIKGGLLYRIKGKSDSDPCVLMAHFDVVPVNEENWSVDPFGGIVKDGFLWGRGTLDTKCSLFGIMESAESLLKSGFVPQNDIYLSFGCNEEIAGDCAPSIVKTFKERGIKPAFVLDEGGTILKSGFSFFPHNIAAIGISEKGPMDVELTVKGESGHASQPPKHTAVGKLAQDICKIENHQFPMQMNPAVKAMISGLAPHSPYWGRLILANMWAFSPLVKLICKKNKTTAALFRTSMAFTQTSGSNGANVLPQEAKAVVNVRLANGCKSTDAVEYMKKAADDPDLSMRIVNFSEATPCADASGKYWDIMTKAVSENFDNTIVAPYLMMGGTDSRFFNEITDSIYKFAPTLSGDGLLKTIHSDDERIRLDNIPGLINFYACLMENL
ncbi:MAG: M20/M25/M40 family metallo-hydrolase [Faecalibacterium sp.]|nr:M20/M25/M40 family metallo-hydrolase [Ruminococcus sp.]MCM1392822.1 M20/M25/M40 family metallo-hydrolase [Ruminococcus sp.]MCM1485686.1 M20/M25/M40 family metallo-hydrolase [Faecalibacterium sp.]